MNGLSYLRDMSVTGKGVHAPTIVPEVLDQYLRLYPLTPLSRICPRHMDILSLASAYTLDTWTPPRSVGQNIVFGP